MLGLAASARAGARFSQPQRGEVLAAGDSVEVRWTAPLQEPPGTTETELVLSLDGGVTFPIRVTPEMTPNARGFRWQVPALETAHARLALRVGAGEDSTSERLEAVSEEFSIVAAEDEPAEDLVRGPREWWTRQALDGAGTEDLPDEAMADASERLVAPGSAPDIHEPPGSGLTVPAPSSVPLPDATAATRARAPRRTPSPSARELPLRL